MRLLLWRVYRGLEALLTPLLGWLLAGYFFEHASLLWAYLLAAPGILFFVVLKLLPFGKTIFPPESTATREMRNKVSYVAKLAEVKVPLVAKTEEPLFQPPDATRVRGGVVLIFESIWNDLSEQEKEFACAIAVTRYRRMGAQWPQTACFSALSIVAAAFASVSVVSIPISWLVLLTATFFFMGFKKELVQEIRPGREPEGSFRQFFVDDKATYDREAFRLTGNLGAAISYLEKMSILQKDRRDHEERIELLRTGGSL